MVSAGQRVYIITDPALVHEVLVVKNDKFEKAQLLRDAVGAFLGKGLLTNEGESWKRQRKLVQPAFHFSASKPMARRWPRRPHARSRTARDGETRDIRTT